MPKRILWNLYTAGEQDQEDLSDWKVFDVRDFQDDWNEPSLIAARLLEISNDVKLGKERIVIKCQLGLSRSNTFAIGVLCLNYGLSWEDAFTIVKCLNPRANPLQPMQDCMKEALRILGVKLG